jgi:hypothetical protein
MGGGIAGFFESGGQEFESLRWLISTQIIHYVQTNNLVIDDFA